MKMPIRAAFALLAALACAPATAQRISAPGGFVPSQSGPAVVPAKTTALASSLVVATGESYLLGFTASASAAGYFLLFDAASAPADGAVTPPECIPYPTAGQPLGVSFANAPFKAATGIVIVFSTTGCFTKTASATAYISAKAVQP